MLSWRLEYRSLYWITSLVNIKEEGFGRWNKRTAGVARQWEKVACRVAVGKGKYNRAALCGNIGNQIINRTSLTERYNKQ